MLGRVLVVAGSDSGGGAGIQADIKTITVLGGFATTAITALTAQNTLGVHGVFEVSPQFIEAQMDAVLDDLGTDSIKTGMLGSREVVEVVAGRIERLKTKPHVVVDPVMVAKGGASLLAASATEALLKRLLPLADVVTPNAPEAEVLTKRAVRTLPDLTDSARALVDLGARAALVKGGHLEGDIITDVLVRAGDKTAYSFAHPRVASNSTHGTGCTLASAIATFLARGDSLERAVELARKYVRGAIVHAPGLGAGHGPMHHGFVVSSDGPAET